MARNDLFLLIDLVNIFNRVWDNLVERTEGPMHFRFLMQPVMSLIFAIRAGIRDAKSGTVPYLWRFLADSNERKQIAGEAWKDVGKIFILAVLLDITYQLVVIFGEQQKEGFYPLESLIVAALLAIVPYIIFRGPINRLVRMFINKKKRGLPK